MGLLSKSSAAPVTADGVHPQQHHHLGRDAALIGGAGVVAAEAHHHHEKKKLGGGLFSKRKSVDAPIAPGEANPYMAGNGVPAAGATNGHHLTNGFGTGAGDTVAPVAAAAPVGAAGAPVAGSTGFTGAHTGPAPINGHAAPLATGAVAANGTSSPPVHGLNTTGVPAAAGTLKDANKLDRKGNMEGLVGGLLCSTSMKQKAATHHAQADHLRMQASELDEAERLEHEAGMRRQRAVGLGADPAHATGQTGFNPNPQTATA